MKVISSERRGDVRIVLTEGILGGPGDYAVYIGLYSQDDHTVALHGHKLSAKEALPFFPNHLKSEDDLRY